jgi:hypothetical protein
VARISTWWPRLVRRHRECEYIEYRRFCEFPVREVRDVFAVYDLLLTASFLIGYLQEMGTHLNHLLVEVDLDG